MKFERREDFAREILRRYTRAFDWTWDFQGFLHKLQNFGENSQSKSISWNNPSKSVMEQAMKRFFLNEDQKDFIAIALKQFEDSESFPDYAPQDFKDILSELQNINNKWMKFESGTMINLPSRILFCNNEGLTEIYKLINERKNDCDLESADQNKVNELIELHGAVIQNISKECEEVADEFKDIFDSFKEKIEKLRSYNYDPTLKTCCGKLSEDYKGLKDFSDNIKDANVSTFNKKKKRNIVYGRLSSLLRENGKTFRTFKATLKSKQVVNKVLNSIQSLKDISEFWKYVSLELKFNEELLDANVKNGEWCVKECGLNQALEHWAKIRYFVYIFCEHIELKDNEYNQI